MMRCFNNVFGHPCGYCMACRLNKQREKKVRLVHECESWQDKVFLTLTYAPEKLPPGRTLVKRDVQLFLKRLRKAIEPLKIKYFCCGEYGEREDATHRPHYHLIVYGLSLTHPVFKKIKEVKSQNITYVDLGSIWDKGFVSVSPVTPKHCAYVAKYCLKKLGGKLAEQEYKDKQPPFALCSRGIGLEWAQKHHDKLVRDMSVRLGRQKMVIPRYYVDKVFDFMEKFKRERFIKKSQDEALDREFIDMMNAGLDFSKPHAVEQYRRDLHEARLRTYGLQLQKYNMKGKTKNV